MFNFIHIPRCFYLLIISIYSLNVKATTYYTVAAGPLNWSSTLTWAVSCGGAGGAGVPTATDDVVICATHTVTMDGNAGNCLSLTINGTARWTTARTTNVFAGGITINPGGDITGTGAGILTTTGGLVINAVLTSTAVNIRTQTTAGQAISGTGTLSTLTINATTTNNGTLTIRTSLAGSSTLTQGAGSTINYAGSTVSPTLDAATNDNDFNYTAASGTQTVKATTYHNLGISGGGNKNAANNFAINGDLTINGGTLVSGTRQITGNATGLLTMASGATLSIGTNRLFPTNFIKANISLNSGSTVTYNGNNGQPISSVPDYGNLSITTFSGNKSANGNLVVTGNLSTTSPSTLAMTSYDLDLEGDYISTGGLSFTTGAFDIAGSFTNSGTYTCGTGTVDYDGTGSQTVRGTTYNNLILSGSGAVELGANVEINNDITISDNLDASSFLIDVNGDWINNGTFSPQTGTVLFSGTSAQTISSSTTTNFNNLTINNTAGVSISSGSYTLSETLTLSNGVFSTGGNNFTMLSTSTQTARIAPVTGTGDVSGNFTIERFIDSRGTLTWANLSSPVQATTVQDWDDELFFYYPHTPPTGISNVLIYDEAVSDYDGVTSATAITPGMGFEIYLTDDATLTGFSNTTMNTIGVPTTGDQNIILSYTAANAPYDGENLVGNPFASSIQVNQMSFTNALTSIDVFDNTSENYLTLSGTDEVAPHQGFWAYATALGASISVPETAKTTSIAGTLRYSEKNEYMQLTLASADGSHTMSHTLKIATDATAKNGWDYKDHPYRKSPNKEAPFITANSDKCPLVITTFNSTNENHTITLSSGVGVEGKYMISVKGMEVMNDFTCILLKDKFLDKIIDLKRTPEYYFDAIVGDNTQRFEIYFSKNGNCRGAETATAELNGAQILQTVNGVAVNFNYLEVVPTQITVVNILGQELVKPMSLDAQNQKINIDIADDFHGIYLVKIISEKGEMVKKMIRP